MNPELKEVARVEPSAVVPVTVEAQRNKSGHFLLGQSGNPSGHPRKGRFKRALLRQLNAEIASGITRLDCVADGMVTLAETDVKAAEFVRDTVDGAPDKTGGGGGGNITIQMNCITE